MVLKIYFPKQRDGGRREKLSHMVAYDPKIPGLCWPKALAETLEGEWVGYLMPRAQGKELALTVFHPGRNNSTLTALGWTRRSLALIAANIADTFRQMHEKGILMGDINPRNFIVGEDCSVYLVDCDSYQFEDFPCPVGTPLYTPPEVHRAMKAANRENYGYIRTEDNERYSLAVLLFEILMLGKAPYESRNTNNQDVIDAIIAGNFPYPYNVQRGDDADDKETYRQNSVKAPVGRWRQIWSNTTYMVKTKFYNTFTGKGRTSAAEWAWVLQEYARQIELGHSSDALVPDGFKDTSGREGSDDTKMVDLVCEMCGKPFNLAEDVYQARMQREEPILCATHWEFRKNMGRRIVSCTCSVCGKSFDTTAREWIQQSRAGLDMVCRDCADREIQVSCSKCGREYWEKQRKVQVLQAQGNALLCTDCLPWVVCDVCGEKFRTPRENLEKRKVRYDDNGNSYYRPWLILVGDGDESGSSQALDQAAAVLKAESDAKHLSVLCVTVGDEDKIECSSLMKLAPDGKVQYLRDLKFGEFFSWLSRSIQKTSQSMSGEEVHFAPTTSWGEVLERK